VRDGACAGERPAHGAGGLGLRPPRPDTAHGGRDRGVDGALAAALAGQPGARGAGRGAARRGERRGAGRQRRLGLMATSPARAGALLILMAALLGACAPGARSGAAAPAAAKGGAMQTTPSGLQYEDLVVGNGATPQAGQTAQVHYTGWLDNGT